MVIDDLNKFRELEESCGNRYLAVQFVIKCTRILEIKYSGCGLNTSKLIEWVISGESPYTAKEIERRKLILNDKTELTEFLSWVSDEEICDQVEKYYKLSTANRHLTLCTNDQVAQGVRSRINVLLRMIWFAG